jgi:hypothetical protein
LTSAIEALRELTGQSAQIGALPKSWTAENPYILRILGAISRMQLTGIFASGDRIDVGPRAKEYALNAKSVRTGRAVG